MRADLLAVPAYLPPPSYGIHWPVLGGFVLLGLLVWSMLVWFLTRAPEAAVDAPLPPQAVAKLRRVALGRIDEVEGSVARGGMPARRGHHELSQIVRGFVGEVSGLEADTMTATDLRRRGPAPLASVIEAYYPRQFGVAESERPTITDSARAARDVVGRW